MIWRWITENVGWLLIGLGTITSAILSGYINVHTGKTGQEDFVRRLSIASMFVAVFIFFGYMIDTANNGRAQKTILATGDTLKGVTESTNSLAKNIETLANLDKSIDSSTEAIVFTTKELAEATTPIIKSIDNISKKMDLVVDEIKKEQTGYGSIPIVYATFFDYRFKYEGCFEDFPVDIAHLKNNYGISFHLKNHGKYSISSVEIKAEAQHDSHNLIKSIFSKTIYDIKPGQPRDVSGTLVIDTMPFISDLNSCYELTVSWQKLTYKYIIEANHRKDYEFRGIYIFRRKPYFSVSEFLTALKKANADFRDP